MTDSKNITYNPTYVSLKFTHKAKAHYFNLATIGIYIIGQIISNQFLCKSW